MAHDCQETTLARPLLYSVIRLARMVQVVKDRLKGLVHEHAPVEQDETQGPRARKAMNPLHNPKKYPKRASLGSCRCRMPSMAQRGKSCLSPGDWGCTSLLYDLNTMTSFGGFSLCQNAAKDALLLRHDSSQLSDSRDLGSLRRVSALTNALLKRMKCLRRTLTEQTVEPSLLGVMFDDIVCDKFLANLEHLLRCLQQAALGAIVCLCVTWIVASFLQSRHLQHDRDGLFSEWPNGQHPLSTTWPWNVRPSLLVLWGVCWMFYYGDGPSTTSENPQNVRAPAYGQDFRTRPASRSVGQEALPQAHATGALTSPVAPPNYSWPLQHQQANLQGRRANYPPIAGHNNDPAYLASTGASSVYITPSYGSSAQLPPTPVTWTYPQPSHFQTAASQSPSPNIWPQQQPPINELDFPASLSPGLNTSPSQPDATPSRPLYSVQLPASLTQAANSAVIAPSLNWSAMYQPQTYPSPHSEVSGPTHPSNIAGSVAWAPLSPSKANVASPSIGSPESRHSGRRSIEPTRNAEGLFFCNFPECQSKPNPEYFTRLCEWTKHIEKHTRPYICHEPGCENIRGFTYSGGLHRHQREVHQQHGGPKSICFCPFKDCKRSTGVGFSRRENLNEHLRRVHRNASAEGVQDPSNDTYPPGGKPVKRKRKTEDEGREGLDSDTSPPSSQQSLKQEVKKLRRELKEKDERLRRLESQMERLQRGQQRP